MSIQATFDNQAISQLPRVSALIDSASNPEFSEMNLTALRKINNCFPCLDDMTDGQKLTLEDEIIRSFNHFELIN